jgi:hypothetical protein
MNYHEKQQGDMLLSGAMVTPPGKSRGEHVTVGLPLTVDGVLPSAQPERGCSDYSEEAIPERDPAYCLPEGTVHETLTVEYVPAAERLALLRCLEQLGMSAVRAAMVASL